MQFVKDNWIWFASPIVTALIVVAVLFSLKERDGSNADYVYQLN
ncbi:MAG: hypothetical protein O2816_11450 [Planctomycetota bacterium]|nr:hypothetical protein [Planctomycetota bacterium]